MIMNARQNENNIAQQETNDNAQIQETSQTSIDTAAIIEYLERVIKKYQVENPNAHIGLTFGGSTKGRLFNQELGIETDKLDNDFSKLAKSFSEKYFSIKQIREYSDFEKIQSIIDEYFKPILDSKDWGVFWENQQELIRQDPSILAIQVHPSILSAIKDDKEREEAIQALQEQREKAFQKKANKIKNQIAGAYTFQIQARCHMIDESVKNDKNRLTFTTVLNSLCEGDELANISKLVIDKAEAHRERCETDYKRAVEKLDTNIFCAADKNDDDFIENDDKFIEFVKAQINELRGFYYFPGEERYQEKLREIFKQFTDKDSRFRLDKKHRKLLADAIILDLYDNLKLVQQINERVPKSIIGLDESPHIQKTIAEIGPRASKVPLTKILTNPSKISFTKILTNKIPKEFSNKRVKEFMNLWAIYKESKAILATLPTKQQPKKVTEPSNSNNTEKPSKSISTPTKSGPKPSKSIAVPTNSSYKPSKSIATSGFNMFNAASSHGVIPDIYATNNNNQGSAFSHGQIPSQFLDSKLEESAFSTGAIPMQFRTGKTTALEKKGSTTPAQKGPTQKKQ